MNKTMVKIIATALITTSITTVALPQKVDAIEATASIETVQELSMSAGPLAIYVLVGGVIIVNGIIIYDAYKVNDGIIQFIKIPRLPVKYKPNSVLEKVHPKTGKVIQRRYYDENGDPKIDIDLTDHNMPKQHPWPQHKHIWKNGVRQGGEPLTPADYLKYVFIPRGMVNKQKGD